MWYWVSSLIFKIVVLVMIFLGTLYQSYPFSFYFKFLCFSVSLCVCVCVCVCAHARMLTCVFIIQMEHLLLFIVWAMHAISDSHIFICSKCDSDIRSLVLRNPLIQRLKCNNNKWGRCNFQRSKNYIWRKQEFSG